MSSFPPPPPPFKLRNKASEWLGELCQRLVGNDSTFTELDLSDTGRTIDDDEARALGEALSQNTVLKRLTLWKAQIGTHGIDFFAQGLVGNATLEDISLSSVDVGDKGAAVLARCVVANNSCPSLKKMRLNDAKVGNEGMSAIAKELETNKGLEVLDLANNNVGCGSMEEVGNALKINGTLLILNLASNRISDSGADMLFDGLKHSVGLQYLHLFANRIGNRGASSLGNSLRLNTSLKMIALDCNLITSHGAMEIAKGLTQNRVLEELSLFGPHCIIGKEVRGAFEDALRNHNRTLTNLMLDVCHIDKSECRQQNSIMFHCHLNGSGRQLVGNGDIPCSLWPYILANMKGKRWSTAQLFWYLREKPDLFQEVANGTTRLKKQTLYDI